MVDADREAHVASPTALVEVGSAAGEAVAGQRPETRPARIRRVALAGNPNAGKSSIFNALTGAKQHVGNYPGVTVEKRSGRYLSGGLRHDVADLPGTYSLTSYSPEERIAQAELLTGGYDVVVVVVDSSALRRSLVLLAQVMQTGAKPVLCLNMSDEAEQAGQRIDVEQMRALLGFPIVKTVGHRGHGIEDLRNAIETAAEAPARPNRLVLGLQLDRALHAIGAALECSEVTAAARPWIASRLLLGDDAILTDLRVPEDIQEASVRVAGAHRDKIEATSKLDIVLYVTERYYGFVDGLLREVVQQGLRADARAVSNRIDSVLVHPMLGLPVFALVMYAIFWVTFTVGDLPMGWIEAGFAALGQWVSSLWPEASSSPLRSLIVDGVIGGVGGVIVFLPNVLLLFLGLGFLEDSGYMARAAFLVDRAMHRFGLHGKSFVPMMTGFGCSIPGIMATRTLENERDRLTTMLVLPLMSCGARLPIWMLLIPAFFAPSWRAPALFLIYAVGILMALALALLLRRSVLKGEEAPFVMELPPYRMPTLKAVLSKMQERGWLYVQKAGTVILGISIVMWFLAAYPKAEHHAIDDAIAAGEVVLAGEVNAAVAPRHDDPGRTVDARTITADELSSIRAGEDLEASFAGRLGRALEPFVAPLGFDWKLGTAMIGAFAAKEVFVAQMGVVYSLGETDEGSEGLRQAIRRDYSPLVGISLMLFLLIATPCMATIAVTRRESGSWKWAAFQLVGLTAVAYLTSLIVYQVGRLFL